MNYNIKIFSGESLDVRIKKSRSPATNELTEEKILAIILLPVNMLQKQFISCPNQKCSFFQKKGQSNIKFKSKKEEIFYCSGCKKTWRANTGTFLYNLKTPTKIVLRCLLALSSGQPLRKTARTERVTTDSIFNWMKRANRHSLEVIDLMKKELALTKKELDRFTSFIADGKAEIF